MRLCCEEGEIDLPEEWIPPTLALGLDLFAMAFDDLSTCRAYEGAPIPWLATKSYCEENQIDDFEYLWSVIKATDSKYLPEAITVSHQRAKQNQGN